MRFFLQKPSFPRKSTEYVRYYRFVGAFNSVKKPNLVVSLYFFQITTNFLVFPLVFSLAYYFTTCKLSIKSTVRTQTPKGALYDFFRHYETK